MTQTAKRPILPIYFSETKRRHNTPMRQAARKKIALLMLAGFIGTLLC